MTATKPLTRADVERMEPADINARWSEVSALLAGSPVRGTPLTDAEIASIETLPASRLDAATVNASWDRITAELRRRGLPVPDGEE